MFRIHKLHHHVLSSWQELKDDMPQVVTLDHHTDILPAFLRCSEQGAYPAEAGKNLENDIKLLRHDEHFDYALKYGMISKAFIISHTPAVTETNESLQVFYNEDFSEDEPLNSSRYREYFNRALEDDFLSEFYRYLPHENYILDIDCDYFKTERSLTPVHSEIFFELLRNAEMITVSLEEDWVRLLTFENPSDFTAEYIVGKLKKMYDFCKK